MPTVVGIDTSLTSTGLCSMDSMGAAVQRVRSKGKAADTLAMRRARLDKLAGDIVRATLAAAPDLAVIEAPSYGNQNGHMHDRSGLWWLVVFSLGSAGVPVLEVSPSTRMKYATGKGGGKDATKDAVLTSVVRRYPLIPVADNNEADAVLLASIGMRMLGSPVEVGGLPQTHVDALKVLMLP